MPKSFPDLNELAILTNADKFLVRDETTGFDHFTSFETIKSTINGTFATPEDYGAVGDGVTDDTAAVQACFDAVDITYLPNTYAVTSNVIATKFLTCINGGGLKYTGLETNPVPVVLDVRSPEFGHIYVDANTKEVKCVSFSQAQTYNGVSVETVNCRAADSAKNVSCGIIVNGNAELHLDSFVVDNFTNTGHTNDSVPQALINNGRAFITKMNVKEGRAAVVTDSLDESTGSTAFTYVNDLTCQSCGDNGVYALGGWTRIGNMTYEVQPNPASSDEGEEVIVNQASVWVDSLTVIGNAFSAVRIQNAEYTYVGHIHGSAPRSYTVLDLGVNCPRGILSTRSSNDYSGPVVIGGVTGKFSDYLVRCGTAGLIKSIKIGQSDVELYFNIVTRNTANAFQVDDFWNTDGALHVDFRDIKIRAVDNENGITTSTSDYLQDSIYSTNMKEESYLKNFDVTIHQLAVYDATETSNTTTANYIKGKRIFQSTSGIFYRSITGTTSGDSLTDTAKFEVVTGLEYQETSATTTRNYAADVFVQNTTAGIRYISTASTTSGDLLTDTSKFQRVEEVPLKLHNVGLYRGQRADTAGLLTIDGAVWQTNVGPYRREANLGPRETTIVDSVPTNGYWRAGQELRFRDYDPNTGDEGLPYGFMCVVSGSPGTWREIPCGGLNQAGTGFSNPVGNVTPNYIGQIHTSTAGTPFISYGTTNSDWSRCVIEARSGTSSPISSVTPNYEGEIYVDTTNDEIYLAFGTSNTSWTIISKKPRSGTGGPIGVVTPDYIGQTFARTDTTNIYISYGLTSSDWKQVD